jgi:hypothetical protein
MLPALTLGPVAAWTMRWVPGRLQSRVSMAGVYWLGPSSKVRYTVPPRFAGGSSPCRNRCLREAWSDGCLGEGLTVGLLRVGAFAPGGLTIGVS